MDPAPLAPRDTTRVGKGSRHIGLFAHATNSPRSQRRTHRVRPFAHAWGASERGEKIPAGVRHCAADARALVCVVKMCMWVLLVRTLMAHGLLSVLCVGHFACKRLCARTRACTDMHTYICIRVHTYRLLHQIDILGAHPIHYVCQTGGPCARAIALRLLRLHPPAAYLQVCLCECIYLCV